MANLRVGTGITFDGATGNFNTLGIGTVRGGFPDGFNVGTAATIHANGNVSCGIITTTNIVNSTQLSHRNLIINGAMQVAQRGTSSTSSGYQTVDRFYLNTDGVDEAPTQAQVDVSSGTTPYTGGFRKAFKITNGNQTGGAGSADNIIIQYYIEAQDIASSGWNYTSSSSYITLSFWVKSSVAQNYFGRLMAIDGTQQNYPFETGSLTADTWTKITKTIPGNSNIQFDNDVNRGLSVEFCMFRGTDKTGSVTLNQWAAYSSATRIPDMTSTWYTTNDATFEITGVQLEVGSVATPFEHRSFGDELTRCFRYYEQLNSNAQSEAVFASGYFESTGQGRHCLLYSRKRATPTITATSASTFMNLNTGSVPGGDTITIKKPTETGAEFQLQAGSSGTDGQSCILASKDASTEATIKISSEL